MSHVTYMNESYHTREWTTTHGFWKSWKRKSHTQTIYTHAHTHTHIQMKVITPHGARTIFPVIWCECVKVICILMLTQKIVRDNHDGNDFIVDSKWFLCRFQMISLSIPITVIPIMKLLLIPWWYCYWSHHDIQWKSFSLSDTEGSWRRRWGRLISISVTCVSYVIVLVLLFLTYLCSSLFASECSFHTNEIATWAISRAWLRYWVVSRVYGVMSHIWMGHVAHTNSSWIKSYARMRHVSYLMRVISLVPYLHVSCHIYECVMSHIWIGHVTYMKVSYLCTSFTANEKSEWEWFLLLSWKWYHHDDNIIMGITIIGTIIVALMIIGINQSNHSHHHYLSPPMRCVISGLFLFFSEKDPQRECI